MFARRILALAAISSSLAASSALLVGCPPAPADGEGEGEEGEGEGEGEGEAALTIDPTVQGFGSVVVGEQGAPVAFTVTNAGGDTSGTISASVTGDFIVTGNDCGALDAGATCTVSVTFAPGSEGTVTGSVTVTATPGGTASAALNGDGQGEGELSIDNAANDFGDVLVGASSGEQTFTITNNGGGDSGVLSTSIGGADGTQFNIASDECVDTALAGGASCSITVTFDPTSAGNAAATLSVTGAPGGTVTAALTGTGLGDAALSINPTSRNFGSVILDTLSIELDFDVTNTGDVPSGALVETIVGVGAADFEVTASGCAGTELQPGATCTITVQFQPSGAVGLVEAELHVDGAPGGALIAALTGTAQAAGEIAAEPTALDFGDTIVGATSGSRTVVITNTGGATTGPLSATLSGVDSGQFPIVSGGNGCQGVLLAAGAQCTVAVSFSPTSRGAKIASLTVTGNPGGTALIALAGNGQNDADLSVNPINQDFGSVATGTASSPIDFDVTNDGDVVSGAITAALSGANFAQFVILANGCTAPLAPAASCTITVTYNPNAIAGHTAQLDVSATPGGSENALLVGQAVSPAALVVNPTAQGFGTRIIGQTADQIFTVTNNGQALTGTIATTLSGADASQFAIVSEDCNTLALNQSCTISVRFQPNSTAPAAAKVATLDVTASPGGAVSSALTGTAQDRLTVTVPAVLPHDFGALTIGAQSGLQTFTFTQTAGGAASGALTVTNAFGAPAQFLIGTDGCTGQNLAAGASCSITARFAPSGAPGARTGSITVANVASGSTAVATLAGSAAGALAVNPATRDFGNQVFGTAGGNFTFTFANTAAIATGTLSTALVGGADFFIVDDNCAGVQLAANNAVAGGADECTLLARFVPTALGARTGSITVSGNPGNSITTDLSGNGITAAALSVAPAAQDFGSVQAGVNDVANNRTFTVTNTGQQTTSAITFANVGGDGGQFEVRPLADGTTCVAGTTTLALNATCAIVVRFRPATNSQSATPKTTTLEVSATTGGTDTAALSGLSASQLSASVANVNFGDDVIDAVNTAGVNVIITNDGTTATSALNRVVTGAFNFETAANDCIGVSLAAGAQCAVRVRFNADGPAGAELGTLTVAGAAGDVSISVAVTGNALDPASITGTMSPVTRDFGGVILGSQSASKGFTVTNTGDVTSGVLAVTITEDAGGENDVNQFQIVNNGCNGTLAAGASCTVTALFSPSVAGVRDVNLNVTGAGTATAFLFGNGLTNGTDLHITPTPVDFADTAVGASSAATAFTVTNTRAAATGALVFTASANFQLVAAGTTCVAGGLAGGAACVQNVRFSPTTAGAKVGTFSVTGTGLAAAAALTGTAIVPATITINTNTFTFPLTGTGTTSAPATFTVTNTGAIATGTVSAPALSGGGADVARFNILNNTCTGTLDPAEACTFQVTFSPNNTNTRNATVTVNVANANPASVASTLAGTGANPADITIAPSANQTFANAAVGGNGNTIVFTVTNDLNAANTGPLGFTLSNEADFDIVGGDCTQGVQLTGTGAARDCTINVRFNPSPTGAVGAKAGTLNVTSNPGGNVSVNLAGTATAAMSIAVTTPFPANTAVGTQTQSVLTVTNNSSQATGLISVVLGGVNANQFAIVDDQCAGNTRAAAQTCTITLRFVPTTTGVKAGNVTVSATPGDSAVVAFTPNAN